LFKAQLAIKSETNYLPNEVFIVFTIVAPAKGAVSGNVIAPATAPSTQLPLYGTAYYTYSYSGVF